MSSSSLIQINACFACDTTGVVARHPNDTARFASKRDLERLLFLRTQHHAVLLGGATFRAWPQVHKHPNDAPAPVHILITSQWESLYNSPLWQACVSGRVVLHVITAKSPPSNIHPPTCHWYCLQDSHPNEALFSTLKRLLQDLASECLGIKAIKPSSLPIPPFKVLLCGGASLFQQLHEARMLHTLYLTRCPVTLKPISPDIPPPRILSPKILNALCVQHHIPLNTPNETFLDIPL
jgi:dihydrofolate reductase